MNSQQIKLKLCVQKEREKLKHKKDEIIKKRFMLLKQVIQLNTILCKLRNYSKQDILQVLENDLQKNQNSLEEIEKNTQNIKLDIEDLIEDRWDELKLYKEKMYQRSNFVLDLENKYAPATFMNYCNDIQQYIISFKNKYEYENEIYSKSLKEFKTDVSYNLSKAYEMMLNECQNNESHIERKYYILTEQINRLRQNKRKTI